MKIIKVRVKPGSKEEKVIKSGGQVDYEVYVRERAEKGKANKALINLLSEFFGCAKRDVEILRGHGSRIKIVKVNG